MKEITILNDQHLGVRRKAGATEESATALEGRMLAEFKLNLLGSKTRFVIVLGDLFDRYQVSNATLKSAFTVIVEWSVSNPKATLVLVRGNHDYSNDTSKVSSFDLLSSILSSVIPNLRVVTSPTKVMEINAAIIPHVPNQEVFNAAIDEYSGAGLVLLGHCNYENNFTKDAEHSLNLTNRQAQGFKHVYLGHEHRFQEHENVTCVGIQFPSSVADCLKQIKNFKLVNGSKQAVTQSDFIEVDWRLLKDKPRAEFIRVIGSAKPEEFGLVVSAIAGLRKKSDSFVIANAVRLVGPTNSTEDAGLRGLAEIDPVNQIKGKLSQEHQGMLEGVGL